VGEDQGAAAVSDDRTSTILAPFEETMASRWRRSIARLDKLDAEVARICGRKGAVGDAWLERPVTGQHERPAAGQTWRENYVEGVEADGPKERATSRRPTAPGPGKGGGPRSSRHRSRSSSPASRSRGRLPPTS
jgi:hypothetical protein